MSQLNAEVHTIDELTDRVRGDMYRLYAQFYDATDQNQFNNDLDGKTHTILMRDQSGVLQGFTSLARYWHNFQGMKCQIVYSGDTIVHQEFWGEQTLPETWIALTGQFKSEYPDQKLFWFLIVKGHRTYRYLSIFSKNYFPCHNRKTPTDTQQLINTLASARFGKFYKADTGLIQFPESRGHLKSELSTVPDNALKRADVSYFLKRNPGYGNGDELVCITELSLDNLSRRARVYFEKGLIPC